MSFMHKCFLLDVDGFKRKIGPVIKSLNSGTAETLYENVLQVSQAVEKEWVLKTIDGDRPNIREQDFVGIPYKQAIESQLTDLSKLRSADIGYWFLMILSAYLEKCDGIGPNFEILEWCLSKGGWSAEDIKMLIYATPTSLLLKNDSEIQPEKLSNSDPYWYWMRPAYSKESGWLSQSQIAYLLHKLQLTEEFINTFDPNQFGTRWGKLTISIPDGQVDYLNRAKAAYYSATRVLETATLKKRGLYIVISYT
jgi:hypothetical protein